MHLHTLLAYAAIAALAIMSPGPAILLTLRNGASFGARSVLWSALGNVSGVFCLSLAAILGLGVLLMSSALLFGIVKLLGAGYLFYIGVKHLFSRGTVLAPQQCEQEAVPARRKLYIEAFLTAATNPKAVLFFTALFPQFVDAHAPILPQFFILTGVFMLISYATHLAYATLAAQTQRLLSRPGFSAWLNRVVGTVFIGFGGLLLTLRRQSA
jgi:threonine/homoserine/homoserine lactone efflux protein